MYREIKGSQDYINDLINVVSLPAIWNGGDPSRIVQTLIDALVEMLRLDFGYARLRDSINSSTTEIIRLFQQEKEAIEPRAIGKALDQWLAGDPPALPVIIPNPAGEGNVSMTFFRFGLEREIGLFAVGSGRKDFPTKNEMLILRVAANQAAIGLQETLLLSDQKRSKLELDQKVAERTTQLSAVNEELVKEIDERKRAECALRKAQAELAHITRVTTLGELTASIAHEINQPLGAIVTNGNACLHLLLRDQPDLKRIREAVECIISDAGRASEVIKRIRVPLKKADTEKVLLKINEVIRETIALVNSELNKNHVLLRTELEADMPLIRGDKIQLQQVLLNLILNAIEAMNEAEHPRELVISAQHLRPYEITVELKDTGTGIAPQNSERIFDAFFTTKHKDGGLGLGLSISRTIIEAHDGWLWATANEGKGATFKFTVLTSGES